MATAENAMLKMEVAQEPVASEAMTDSGDHTTFSASDAPWSRVNGFTPTVRPNGIKTGGTITPQGDNSKVTVAASSANLNGVVVAVVAADITMTRPANAKKKISSIILEATGSYTQEVGADGDSYSETRGAGGGPPVIEADDVEVGQVKIDDDGAVPVVVTDIRQVPGVHTELASYPLWSVDYLNGQITFVAVLPLSHAGTTAKRTFCAFYTPVLVAVPQASDFKFPEETHAIASVQTYDGAIASSSKSLNQGSFKAKLQNGLDDLVVAHKNENLWWEFYPDKNQLAHGAMQGILGVSRTFPAGALLEADCTISSETSAVEVL